MTVELKFEVFLSLQVQNSITMENNYQVEFRNIGCSYFPESRVDVHYTVSSQHKWASSDWVGLFKVLFT